MELPQQQLEQDQKRQSVAVEPIWKPSRRELQRSARQASDQRGNQIARMHLGHHPPAAAELTVAASERLEPLLSAMLSSSTTFWNAARLASDRSGFCESVSAAARRFAIGARSSSVANSRRSSRFANAVSSSLSSVKLST